MVRVAPTLDTLEEITRGLELSPGARRLLELLHRLAQDVLKIRGHRLPPSQLVMHQAQELLAAALGAHRVTVWRWSRELERAGLLATRAHKATTRHRGADVTRNDGTLYAVPLRASHKPRLRFDDLRHQYRDLDADRRAGKTAFQTLQQSSSLQEGEWYLLLRDWAVTPGSTSSRPVDFVDCCTGPNSVQDVVYTLPLVAQAHPTKRAELVGILGAALARHLGDTHSRRWYCALIWAAWRDECEGRPGLQVLAAQLARIAADIAEGAPWRNTGAVLAARLRPA